MKKAFKTIVFKSSSLRFYRLLTCTAFTDFCELDRILTIAFSIEYWSKSSKLHAIDIVYKTR